MTGREKQIVDERIKKIAMLKKEGINPYAHRFNLNDKRCWGSFLSPTYPLTHIN